MRNEFYFHTAYVVAVAIYVLYSASLWFRSRDLARREAVLDEADRRRGRAR